MMGLKRLPVGSLFLLIAVLLTEVNCKPYFIQEPGDIEVTEGTTTVLPCRISGIGDGGTEYTVVWLMNTTADSYKYIQTDTPRYTYQDRYNRHGDHRLTIQDVMQGDEASYKCVFYNGTEFMMWSRFAALDVVPPMFRQHPGHRLAIEGDSVVLPCQLDEFNDKMFVVHWMKGVYAISHNHRILDPTSLTIPNIHSRYFVRKGDSNGEFDLEIEDAMLEDSGEFTCVVYRQNEPYLVTYSETVTVSVISQPIKYPACQVLNPSDNFIEGSDIFVACVSRSSQEQVHLSWRKNGEYKRGSLVRRGYPDISDTWPLSANDNGAYITCGVEGTSSKSADDECTIGPIDVKFSPFVSQLPSSVDARVGDDVKFVCSARANPEVLRYNWYINNKPVSAVLDNGQYKIAQNAEGQILELRGVLKESNNSSVSCQATNIIGSSVAISMLKVDGEDLGSVTRVEPANKTSANDFPTLIANQKVSRYANCLSVSMVVAMAMTMFCLGAFSVTALRCCIMRYRRYNARNPSKDAHFHQNNDLSHSAKQLSGLCQKENRGENLPVYEKSTGQNLKINYKNNEDIKDYNLKIDV